MSELLNHAEQAVRMAQQAGATSADAIVIASTDMNAGIRHGAPETIERAESRGLGLRVFVGQACATLSTSDLSPAAMQQLAETAVAIARAAPADPFAGLAEEALLARALPTVETHDDFEPGMEQLQQLARACEEAGRSVSGITNSEGADASHGRNEVALVTSHGFAHRYRNTHSSISCSLIAGQGEGMERDYDYATKTVFDDLPAADAIGASAAARALARLAPRKIPSQRCPVFFDPRAGKQLLGAFAQAITGPAIARGTSFLKNAMGTALFAAGTHIIDDPLLPRGLGSHPFDAEGIAATTQTMVEGGVLQQWLLDCRSARQLGLQTNGHALRGLSSAPYASSTNLYLAPGDISAQALLASVPSGLYVTETIGHGTNLITGDYSVGASGFWVENGERLFPVSEITIAGNLRDIYAQWQMADDLEFRYGTNVPTLLIPDMTVAGN
jgi:PmbA protein